MLEALINDQQLRKQEKAKLLELQAEKAKLETTLKAQTPTVNAYKRLEASEGSVCIQDAAEYDADGTDGLDACGGLINLNTSLFNPMAANFYSISSTFFD